MSKCSISFISSAFNASFTLWVSKDWLTISWIHRLIFHSAAGSWVCRESYKGGSWEYSKTRKRSFKLSILQVRARCSTRTCLANRYRYNGSWTRDVQNVIFAILLCGWLGGLTKDGKPSESGRLLTIEEVGEILQGMFACTLSLQRAQLII